MRVSISTLFFLIFSIPAGLKAQDSLTFAKQDSVKNKMPNTFYFSVNKDNFYDFYTYAVGSIGITHNKSLVCFALLRGIQFGTGITFLTWKNQFVFTPFVSVLNGKVQSGSARQLLGETFSPGFVSTFNSKKMYCDNGMIYYKVIREKSDFTFDVLLYWLSLAYKISPKLYIGVHNESLFQTRVTTGTKEFYYIWMGSYVQVNITKSSHFKFIGGYDFKNGDFVRATFGHQFE